MPDNTPNGSPAQHLGLSRPSWHQGFGKALVSVRGMHCTNCALAVEDALNKLPGVQSATVAVLSQNAEVLFDEACCSPDDIQQCIESTGFDAAVTRVMSSRGTTKISKFHIDGMSCSACSQSVESALAVVPGVKSAVVSLMLQEAKVEYDGTLVTEGQLLESIQYSGFEGRLLGSGDSNHIVLAISGMTSSTCSTSVEAALTSLQGVTHAAVDFSTGKAEVQFDPDVVGPRKLIECCNEAGFEAKVAVEEHDLAATRRKELRYWRRLFLFAFVLTLPVFFVSMVFMYIPGTKHWLMDVRVAGIRVGDIIKLVFTTPVQFVIGWRFHIGAVKSIRRGRGNMDVLVSLGTNAAYIYSLVSIIHGAIEYNNGNTMFEVQDFLETSALLITFILLGKFLEAAAKGRTSQAITELMRLAPTTAILVTRSSDGSIVSEQVVDTSLIQRGDLLKVLPGSRVPADGDVVDGRSYVDESMVTGESKPVTKGARDTVISGTVNGSGNLIIRATRVGSDTTLAQIVRLVEAAQMSKAPIQAFADKLSSRFVPAVVLVALLTWMGWYLGGILNSFPSDWIPEGSNDFIFAFLFGISVLVIACPCALGLATPTAIMVGTGVGASNGILIKGADALERAHKLSTVVFDKTGTLTVGRPAVTNHLLLNDKVTLQEVLLAISAAETCSEHPLAQALLKYAQQELGLKSEQNEGEEGVLREDGVPSTNHDSLDVATDNSTIRSPNAPEMPSSIMNPNLSPTPSTKQLLSRTPSISESNGDPVYQTPSANLQSPTTSAADARDWIPQAKDVEIVSGKGVKCWLQPEAVQECLQKITNVDPTPCGFTQLGGGMASSSAAGVKVVVGNKKMMADEGVELNRQTLDFMREMENAAATCVLVAVNSCIVAVFSINDPLKAEAPGVIAALTHMGLSCHLVSGDNWTTARVIARRVGIKHISAEVLPAGKAEIVKQLQAQKQVVAMVGDGVNDSPALAQSDVGIAIGSGTDIAIEAADYVLMKSDLNDVLTAIDLSKKTFNRIRWNYVWAFAYNTTMIPIAAGVLYPPLQWQLPPYLAGAAMALSSVSVVVSSLMLRRYKRPAPVMKGVTIQQLEEDSGIDHTGLRNDTAGTGVPPSSVSHVIVA